MNSLTNKELQVFNNVSQVLSPGVTLGTKLQQVITNLPAGGTPVNAVAASKLLTLTGVVIDGETVTIGDDVYEFLTDTAQTKTLATNFAVDIEAFTGKATVGLTVVTQPTSGDTMTIGTKVYTFVPVGTDTADGEISRGADLAEAQSNIVAAINGSDEFNVAHTLVSAGAFDANVLAITAFIGGTVSNTIASTETFAAGGNVFGSVTLEGGTNCTAANADGALIDAVTANDTMGVTASQGAGTSVMFTAVAGDAGNDIAIAETMANATFAGDAVELSGGIDGTVGVAGQVMVDATYAYFCTAANSVSGANWRRVAVGAVY